MELLPSHFHEGGGTHNHLWSALRPQIGLLVSLHNSDLRMTLSHLALWIWFSLTLPKFWNQHSILDNIKPE